MIDKNSEEPLVGILEKVTKAGNLSSGSPKP
jgi:hypothetical protein